MVEQSPENVTLDTLHEDLTGGFADVKREVQTGFADLKTEMRTGFADLKTEMRTGFADVKATLVTGFGSLPRRETSEEIVRLLRDSNRLQDERFTQLDLRIREQHLETQQILHAVVEGSRGLIEGQRAMTDEVRTLSADIKALITRLDALIKGRGDGRSSP